METTSDVDVFVVTLELGSTYSFSADGDPVNNRPLADPFLRLLDSSGSIVTSDDDGGPGLNAAITYTPITSGQFYLAVNSIAATSQRTGDYRVSAATVQNDGTPTDDFAADSSTSGRVAIGGTAAGTINRNGDKDWFAVTLQAGMSYVLEVRGADTGNGTLADPGLKLFNPKGCWSARMATVEPAAMPA